MTQAQAARLRVVFHDPRCLGCHYGEFDAPREVLRQLCCDSPLEMALSREKSMCCGAGGGRMWMEENVGKRINTLRVEQALETAPAVIATARPCCAVMVGDGLGALPSGAAVVAQELAERVAAALVLQPLAGSVPAPAGTHR